MTEDNQTTDDQAVDKNAKPEVIDSPPKASRYKTQRQLNNWRTPAGRLSRALIHELMLKQKLGQQGLWTKFHYLWPTCQAYFEYPLNSHQLYSRWWTGVAPGRYVTEHPDKHPEGLKYLPYAREIIAADVPISDEDVQRIVAEVAKLDSVNPSVKLVTI
jgi:hypothetical protein